ncbi:MAG: TlyA family RNA methyltransferase [Antricoccus sp.]
MTERLDALLVKRGMARSRQIARELIESGSVTIDGKSATKASTPIDTDVPYELKLTAHHPAHQYVSRAATKLMNALDACPQVPIEGLRCIDLGASTGGFTQVLLERGASKIEAVDVGHEQLHPSLTTDPRVNNWDRTHLARLDPAQIGGPARLVVADLSFISLCSVMDSLRALVSDDGWLLLMVKPQFEVGRRKLGKGGVVRSGSLRRDAVLRVISQAQLNGLALAQIVSSGLPGPAGNREYFVLLTPGFGDAPEAEHWWPSNSSEPVLH